MAVAIDEPGGVRTRRGFLSYAVDPRGQSWQVALASLAFYIPLSLVVAHSLSDSSSAVAIALGAVLAYALQWLLLTLARRTVIRPVWSSRHPVVTAMVIVAAIIASDMLVIAVTSTSQPGLVAGLDDAAGPVVWVGRTMIFLIVTSIWSSFSLYRAGLASTRALTEQLRCERQAGIDRVQQHRDEVVAAVTRIFEETVTDDGMGSPDDLTAMARERLRPLSHELALTAPSYDVTRPPLPTRAPWRAVVEEITARPVIRPLLMAIVVTFLFSTSTITPATAPPEGSSSASVDTVGTTVSVSVELGSLLWSLGYLIGIFVLTLVTGLIATRVTRQRLPRMTLGRRVAVILSTLLAMALVVEVVIQISYYTPGLSTSTDAGPIWNTFVTVSIFVIALVILSARVVAELFANVVDSERDLNEQLSWEIARANETLAQERRHLASALHGPVQSAVIATGMTLNQDISQGTPVEQAWAEAQVRLTDIVEFLNEGPTTQRSLDQELAELQGTWDGLCTIETDVPATLQERLSTDWVGTATISALLTEAVGNAAMHGRARNVSISLRGTDNALIHLRVVDDGSPSQVTSPPGLGSLTLDEVAVRWERDMTPAGTTVDVWLPMSTGVATRTGTGSGGGKPE